jgi:hypothetical protein
MRYPKPTIPVCRSEFLQDFSIELGRQLKPIRHECSSIDCSLETYDDEGQVSEKMTVWLTSARNTRTTISLWDNRQVWINLTLLAPKNSGGNYHVAFYPDCSHLTPLGIVDALRETATAASGMAFAESPLPALKKIWRYDGQFETKGMFKT